MRLSADQWLQVRAEYESGSATQAALAARWKVSRKAIQKHIESEDWIQDIEPAIRRKVAEKVAGVASKVAARDPAKTAAAIDAEAERRAEVERRHRAEAGVIRERLQAAIAEARGATSADQLRRALTLSRLAKLTAETLAIAHQIERKAWKLDAGLTPGVELEIEVTW